MRRCAVRHFALICKMFEFSVGIEQPCLKYALIIFVALTAQSNKKALLCFQNMRFAK